MFSMHTAHHTFDKQTNSTSPLVLTHTHTYIHVCACTCTHLHKHSLFICYSSWPMISQWIGKQYLSNLNVQVGSCCSFIAKKQNKYVESIKYSRYFTSILFLCLHGRKYLCLCCLAAPLFKFFARKFYLRMRIMCEKAGNSNDRAREKREKRSCKC